MGLLDLAVHHLEGVSLASHATKDGRAVKAKVQGLGELAGGVTEESDLGISVSRGDLGTRDEGPRFPWLYLLTPVCLAGSSCSLHAFILNQFVSISSIPAQLMAWSSGAHSHKRIVDRDDKYLARLLETRVVHVRRDMLARASAREGSGHTNDVPIAGLELLSEVDLVARRVLDEHLQVGDGLANMDHRSGSRVEAAGRGRASQGDAAERSTESHVCG